LIPSSVCENNTAVDWQWLDSQLEMQEKKCKKPEFDDAVLDGYFDAVGCVIRGEGARGHFVCRVWIQQIFPKVHY